MPELTISINLLPNEPENVGLGEVAVARPARHVALELLRDQEARHVVGEEAERLVQRRLGGENLKVLACLLLPTFIPWSDSSPKTGQEILTEGEESDRRTW